MKRKIYDSIYVLLLKNVKCGCCKCWIEYMNIVCWLIVLSWKLCFCDGINEDLLREILDLCYYWSIFLCLKRFLYFFRVLFFLIKRRCGWENLYFVYFGFLVWVCVWLINNCFDFFYEFMFNWLFVWKRLNFYRYN